MHLKNRNTIQKEIVKEEVEKINTFFNAEELYDKAIKKDKNIGIATIYRYLKNLREKNLLHSYICNKKIIYSKDKKSHCHFICQKCNKKEHISIEYLDFLKSHINGKICHFQIDIIGICENCQKNYL